MKKLLTIAAALGFFISSSAFSLPENVTREVEVSFKKSFSTVTSVKWEVRGEVYYGSFSLSGKETTAAFDATGQLLAVSKKIDIADLPVSILQSLAASYSDHIFDIYATVVMMEEDSYYFINAQNDSKMVRLKCFTNGDLEVVKKIRK